MSPGEIRVLFFPLNHPSPFLWEISFSTFFVSVFSVIFRLFANVLPLPLPSCSKVTGGVV